MSAYTRSARKLALGTVIAAASLSAMAAPSMAAPTTKTLNATCDLPLVGLQPATVAITSDLPKQARAFKEVSFGAISTVTTLTGNSPVMFTVINGATVEGKNELDLTLNAPGMVIPFRPRTTIASTPVPENAESVALPGTSDPAAIVTFPQSGTATLSAVGFELALLARDPDGIPIVGLDYSGDDTPETFNAPCTVDPGQNTLLGTIKVK